MIRPPSATTLRFLLATGSALSLLFWPLLSASTERHEDSPLVLQTTAVSQHRVALVIGNAKYRDIRSLENPGNDAKLMAGTLASLGFDVIERHDRTRSDMEADFTLFKQRLRKGSVALFFYAGHGAQFGGKNYLIGADMSSKFDQSNATQGILDIGAATQAIAETSGLTIIILDACRNPTKELLQNHPNLGDGFSEFKNAPNGTYVAYSTSPGKTASDGAGYENSFYTAALAANLKMKPSRLEDVFMRTQIQVEQNTNDESVKRGGSGNDAQVPWTSSSLKTVFYFSADQVAVSPAPKLFAASPLLAELTKAGALKAFNFTLPVINERGTMVSSLQGQSKQFAETLRGTPLDMVEVPGGRFMMGAPANEVREAFSEATRGGNLDQETYDTITTEMPQHAVNVKGFFMSKYEVTQAQYSAVMGRLPNIPNEFRGPNLPVVNVTWSEAEEFCANLSRLTGRLYRLPSEAEWEYAARAGTTTPFAFGQTLTPQIAVYNSAVPFGFGPRGSVRRGPTEVGSVSPANAFGLYDLHGNVWEWCADFWHSGYDGAPVDGTAWQDPEMIPGDEVNRTEAAPDRSRVARGGSWNSPATRTRSASRFRFFPTYRSSSLGFRVVAG